MVSKGAMLPYPIRGELSAGKAGFVWTWVVFSEQKGACSQWACKGEGAWSPCIWWITSGLLFPSVVFSLEERRDRFSGWLTLCLLKRVLLSPSTWVGFQYHRSLIVKLRLLQKRNVNGTYFCGNGPLNMQPIFGTLNPIDWIRFEIVVVLVQLSLQSWLVLKHVLHFTVE